MILLADRPGVVVPVVTIARTAIVVDNPELADEIPEAS
jgi:hypothetical protein